MDIPTFLQCKSSSISFNYRAPILVAGDFFAERRVELNSHPSYRAEDKGMSCHVTLCHDVATRRLAAVTDDFLPALSLSLSLSFLLPHSSGESATIKNTVCRLSGSSWVFLCLSLHLLALSLLQLLGFTQRLYKQIYSLKYFAPSSGVNYCDEYVCLSVHSHMKHHGRTSPVCVHITRTCHRGSILFWQHCTVLCTSGFVDDDIFPINRLNDSSPPYAHDSTTVPAITTLV